MDFIISEKWFDIIGYEKYYQVSILGNIKSKSRLIQTKNFKKKLLRSQPIKTFLDKKGFKWVTLSKKNSKETLKVNLLIKISIKDMLL